MNDDAPVFSLRHCSYSYPANQCVRDISLTLQPGRFYGLVGPNGSGKTTLIRMLADLQRPTGGTIQLHGTPIAAYSRRELARLLSLVPQHFTMEFDYTVFEVVMMGRNPHIARFSRPSEKDVALVEKALIQLDIFELRNRYVTRLSGGEKQRVLVARAMAQNTSIMLLDEATASLDIQHSIEIMSVLRQRVEQNGVTVISAIHDLDLAAAFCNELLVLHEGKLAQSGPVDSILTGEMLLEIFGVEATVHPRGEAPPHIQYDYSHAM